MIREDNEALGKSYEYEYDDSGNRTIMTEGAYSLNEEIPASVERRVGAAFCGTSFCGTAVASEGIVRSFCDTTLYEYDERGRLLDERIAYDNAGRAIIYRNNTVEWNGSQMTKYGRNAYGYDGNNYRVFKQTPTEKTYYSYDGSGNLRFERRGRTEINYIYDVGGIRGMKVTVPTDDPSTYYASSEFYYVKDSLGNIRVILDKSGNIMVKYNYDAWGNFIAEKVREVSIGSVAVDLAELNAFTYRGYYYDKESGLYYLINRYYDPVTGRFISPDDVSYLDFESFFGTNRYYDPVTGRFISPDDVGYLDFESFFGTNRYAYCLDNPVNYIDPEGTFGFWALVAITISAIIIGGSAQVLSNAFAGKTGRDLWRGVAAAAIGSGINALLMCLTAGWSFGLSVAFSGAISALVQTGVDTIETAALGVLKNFQNPIKIGNFRTFLGVLSNIFRLNRLFYFVFSANFRFQNNFQTKIIPKTIPIFIAVFKKSNAKRHLFFVVVAITADLCYNSNNERQNIIMEKLFTQSRKSEATLTTRFQVSDFLTQKERC